MQVKIVEDDACDPTGCTIEKTRKLDWESQAFLWDESEQGADTIE